MLFLDTSALLPYYRQEARSEVIQDLLLHQQSPVLISGLTRVEVASALARWVRMREIEESHAQRVALAFDDDLMKGRYSLRQVTQEQTELARQWLLARTTPLRTLDALQLASAAQQNAILVTLDDVLASAAAQFGVRVHEFS